VRRLLVADAVRLVVGIVSLTLGVASILVQWLRRKTQDRLPLWFGLLALLYGYRALLMTESARYFLSGRTIDFQIALVTFSIGIPGILFGWGLVSKTQNRVTKSLLAVNALMALACLLFYSNRSVMSVLFVINDVFVISFTTAMIVYLFRARAETVPNLKALRIVLLAWGVICHLQQNPGLASQGQRRLRIYRLRCVSLLARLPGSDAKPPLKKRF